MESFSFFSAPSSTFTAYDSPLEVIYLCVPYKLCIAYLSTRRWLLVTDGRDRSQPLARYERLWGFSAAIGRRGGNVRIMQCHVRSKWCHVRSCDVMWHHVRSRWDHVMSVTSCEEQVRSCDVMWHVRSKWDHVMSCDIMWGASEIMWCLWCHVTSCEEQVRSCDVMTCNLSWDNYSVNICWRACLICTDYCVL